MKYIYILIFGLIAFSLLTTEVYTQAGDFRVLSKSGDVQFKKKSSKKWQEVKPGDKLSQSDEVRVFRGGYLGLLHPNGKTVELTDPGTFKLADLAKKSIFKKKAM